MSAQFDYAAFLSDMADVNNASRDVYNLGAEAGIYTVFARNVVLKNLGDTVNLINLVACHVARIERADVFMAPCLEFAKQIVLPGVRNADFACLESGDIFAPDADVVSVRAQQYGGIVFCGPNTRVNVAPGVRIVRSVAAQKKKLHARAR